MIAMIEDGRATRAAAAVAVTVLLFTRVSLGLKLRQREEEEEEDRPGSDIIIELVVFAFWRLGRVLQLPTRDDAFYRGAPKGGLKHDSRRALPWCSATSVASATAATGTPDRRGAAPRPPPHTDARRATSLSFYEARRGSASSTKRVGSDTRALLSLLPKLQLHVAAELSIRY